MSLKCVNSISEFNLVRFVSTVHERKEKIHRWLFLYTKLSTHSTNDVLIYEGANYILIQFTIGENIDHHSSLS